MSERMKETDAQTAKSILTIFPYLGQNKNKTGDRQTNRHANKPMDGPTDGQMGKPNHQQNRLLRHMHATKNSFTHHDSQTLQLPYPIRPIHHGTLAERKVERSCADVISGDSVD